MNLMPLLQVWGLGYAVSRIGAFQMRVSMLEHHEKETATTYEFLV